MLDFDNQDALINFYSTLLEIRDGLRLAVQENDVDLIKAYLSILSDSWEQSSSYTSNGYLDIDELLSSLSTQEE